MGDARHVERNFQCGEQKDVFRLTLKFPLNSRRSSIVLESFARSSISAITPPLSADLRASFGSKCTAIAH